jgi:hypothetical protein
VKWKVLAVLIAAGIIYLGWGIGPGNYFDPTGTPTAPHGLSFLASLDRYCGTAPTQRYVLGNSKPAPNLDSVAISMTQGSRVSIWAHFAQRHLGSFQMTGDGLQVICQVNVPGPGGGPAEIAEARSTGTVFMRSVTDDCARCAGLIFTAKVTIRGR